jgi:thermitase
MRIAIVAVVSLLVAGLYPGVVVAGGNDESAIAPNDSLFEQQRPYFEKMNVLKAWEITKGSPTVVIGVLDSGFDFYHPDLEGRLKPGFYADNVYHTEIAGVVAHGTLVASIMVAKADNKVGMAGLAPDCTVLTASIGMIEHALLKLKLEFDAAHPGATMQEWQNEFLKHAMDIQKFGADWTIFIVRSNADAIRYLVDQGVKVINSSSYYDYSIIEMGGGKEAVKILADAYEYAAANDVVIVIGAGNLSKEVKDYPGDSSTVIVAGASMLDDSRWDQTVEQMGSEIKQGSCYGPRLTVMAPVQNLVVCVPHEERFYVADNGPMGRSDDKFEGAYDTLLVGATSSAAPIVSSLVALVRSIRPDLSAKEVIRIIEQGAVDIGPTGRDIYNGYGRIDFLKTLELAETWGDH